MNNFERIVMISPVGLEKDRVLAGLKHFGITDIYLIQSDEKKDAGKRLADTTRSFASESGSPTQRGQRPPLAAEAAGATMVRSWFASIEISLNGPHVFRQD